MNSLQIGLIAIGALVVALLSLWYWWQARRVRKAVTLPPQTTAPTRTTAAASSPVLGDEPTERVEPTVGVEATDLWVPNVSVTHSATADIGETPLQQTNSL